MHGSLAELCTVSGPTLPRHVLASEKLWTVPSRKNFPVAPAAGRGQQAPSRSIKTLGRPLLALAHRCILLLLHYHRVEGGKLLVELCTELQVFGLQREKMAMLC